MEKDWITYQCKSGQTLFAYNKVTGEHICPLGLPEAIEYRVIYSHPAEQKQVSTIATQTDDTGCNHGYMSMYVNTDTPQSSSMYVAALPQQQSGISNVENSLNCELQTKIEPSDEFEEDQSLQTVTTSQNNFVENSESLDDDNGKDHSAINSRGTDEQDNYQNVYNISDLLKNIKQRQSSTEMNVVDDLGDETGDGPCIDDNYKNNDNISNTNNHWKDCNDDVDENPNSCGMGECVVSHLGNFTDKKQLSKEEKIQEHFQCPVCKKFFKTKTQLEAHSVVHTGEKKAECRVCKKKFSQKGYLGIHIRTHTGEKRYECVYCKKRFNTKCTLNTHIKIHTNEKPFECHVCKRKFGRKETLSNHVKIHTGEKPYECTVCKKKFIQKISLRKHVLIHTG